MTPPHAKGLEFSAVFIVAGGRVGMFPARCRRMRAGVWKRERRRPTSALPRYPCHGNSTLTLCRTRRSYGKEVYHRPSRFIGEPPVSAWKRSVCATVSRPVSHQRMGTPRGKRHRLQIPANACAMRSFGEVKLLSTRGSGEHSRLQVVFRGKGSNALPPRMR